MSGIRDGLLANHQSIFADVAADEHVWILVRATNKASLQYIGKSGFIPKPVECKAKTARGGSNAGLVVCPAVNNGAFPIREDLIKAEAAWKKMAGNSWKWDPDRPQTGLPPGYTIEKSTANYGCLRKGGKLIHGDYDLYDVVDPDNLSDQRRIEKVMNRIKVYFSPKAISAVQKLNERLGTPMIQHGDHLSFDDHSDDMIYAFSPDRGSAIIIIYPFNRANKLASIRGIYSTIFPDRDSRKGTEFTWRVLKGGKRD